MSVVTYTQGQRETIALTLTDTTAQTLVDSNNKSVRTLESLLVSCGNSGTGFTLIWNDGTTDFNVINNQTVAANSTLQLKDHHLVIRPKGSANGSLKVQASAGNQLCVTAVILSAAPMQSAGGAPTA